jgi:hypothetical protein
VRTRTWALALSLTLGGACRNLPPPTRVGHLEVHWNGSREGTISGKATAGWCELRRVLEVHAVQGDTGIALALYPGKSLVSGVYRVVDPTRAESVPPAAGVAVRWLTQNSVQGFQGDSGRVNLERSSSGRLSGSVRARARSVVDTQRIDLTGTFRDLTVFPDSLGCAPPLDAAPDAELGDTGIH